jgi:hypothetical protein
MFHELDDDIKSGIKYERLWHPVTHRMTSNQFLCISPLDNNRSLQRHVKYAGIKCRIYYQGQSKDSDNISLTSIVLKQDTKQTHVRMRKRVQHVKHRDTKQDQQTVNTTMNSAM